MTNEELAYMAGLLDGEGNIGIKFINNKRNCILHVRIFNTCKPVIEWMQEKYEGAVNICKKDPGPHRECWEWCLTGPRARKFLEDVQQYIRIKPEQVKLAIEMQKKKEETEDQ